MKRAILLTVAVLLAASVPVPAVTRLVPSQYPTIQAAIDDCNDGDTAIVAPGTYYENIHFSGKNIALTSTGPEDPNIAAATVIHGDATNPAVSFDGSEDESCRLSGFTITGGYNDYSGLDGRVESGGGISGHHTMATITHCIVTGNAAAKRGGGIGACDGLISQCVIRQNLVGTKPGELGYGAGLWDCDGVVNRCTITRNHANGRAGGLCACDGTILNCLVAYNSCNLWPGGMSSCNGNIVNCTIVFNTKEGVRECKGVIKNCILWGNYRVQIDSYGYASYCCIQGGYIGADGLPGEGIIDADPRFVDPGSHNFHLKSDSPCIDSGASPWPVILPLHDFYGNFRQIDGDGDAVATVDMGMAEYGTVGTPLISAEPGYIEFVAAVNDPNPPAEMLSIRNIGLDTLNWQIVEHCPWLCASPTSGSSTGEIGEVALDLDVAGLRPGRYYSDLFVSDVAASNSPVKIRVALIVHAQGLLRVPEEFFRIQDGIDAAKNGDTVAVGPGSYTGPGNRDIDFKGKAITVRSMDPNDPDIVATTIIDCNGSPDEPHRGFYFHNNEDPNSVLSGFTITYGYHDDGSAIRCDRSSPTIVKCTFSGNSTCDYIMCCRESSLMIANCSMIGSLRGGISFYKGRPRMANCTIAKCQGLGISGYYSNLMMSNCIIFDNAGGGASFNGGWPIITNCTIVGNTGGEAGGVDGHAIIGNCIIWDNSPRQIADDYPAPLVAYSNVEGGWEGEGNIDQDPCFALSTDYHLMPDSPCIDAGTNTPVGGLPAPDIEGNPRTLDGDGDGEGVADMGAYEHSLQRPSMAISTSSVSFSYVQGGSRPGAQKLYIRNCGGKTLNWELVEDCDWFDVWPRTGTSSGQINEVTLLVEPNPLPRGNYRCTLTVLDPSASNSPVAIQVTLQVSIILHVPEEFNTIQAAVDAAKDGDVIILARGTYTGPGNWDIDIKRKAITVRSIDPNDPNIVAATIIDCDDIYDGLHRAFYFHNNHHANSVVAGLTISHLSCAIRCEYSRLRVANCTLTANFGNALQSNQSSIHVTNSTITDNDGWTGLYCVHGSVTLDTCVISKNYDFGLYCVGNSPRITNSTIAENGRDGIVIGGTFESPKVDNCIISNNGGWGIISDCPATITNSAIAANKGGGVYFAKVRGRGKVISCTIAENSGPGIECYGGHHTISNSIIAHNTGWRAGGIVFILGCGTVTNCTIVGNLSSHKGGGIYINVRRSTTTTITNCILSDNWPHQIDVDRWADCAVMYSNVENGWEGQGNIDADPFFVSPGYWADADDPNIIVEPTDPNAVWIDGDYHLLQGSPCINTGDPNYIAGPDETDLDGNPRVIGTHIDMGAYEFNHIPVAEAGPNHVVYAWIDGIAEVTLDGSASYDPDGDELTYLWSWAIDSNTYEANGVNPTIELPVAEHTIELIVSDGIANSEPDCVDVNVVAPLEAALRILPRVINRCSRMRRIMAFVRLPEGITKDQIDSNEPLMLYPAGSEQGIEAVRQFIIRPHRRRTLYTYIFAFFDKAELMDAVPNNGRVELHVVGRLTTAQYFYGSDMASIKCWRRQPPPRRRKW